MVGDNSDESLYFGEVIGSSTSYHRPNCHIVRQIYRRNYKRLRSWQEAVSLGLRPCPHCRPAFIAEAKPAGKDIGLHPDAAPHEPTGWTRVDRTLTEARKQLQAAKTEEQFQAVGLLCREALISLAQSVFDPERHVALDGTRVSDSDSKRMLEAYIAVEYSGSANEHIRLVA